MDFLPSVKPKAENGKSLICITSLNEYKYVRPEKWSQISKETHGKSLADENQLKEFPEILNITNPGERTDKKISRKRIKSPPALRAQNEVECKKMPENIKKRSYRFPDQSMNCLRQIQKMVKNNQKMDKCDNKIKKNNKEMEKNYYKMELEKSEKVRDEIIPMEIDVDYSSSLCEC